MVKRKSKPVLVGKKIDEQNIEALNLLELPVKELSIGLAYGEPVRATVELKLTRAQIAALLNAMTGQCRSVGAEGNPHILWMLNDSLLGLPVIELTLSVRDSFDLLSYMEDPAGSRGAGKGHGDAGPRRTRHRARGRAGRG